MPAQKPLTTLLNSPEYAERVNLIKKIKTPNGWRFAPVVPEANGRLKDRVRINGQLEVHRPPGHQIHDGLSQGHPVQRCCAQGQLRRTGDLGCLKEEALGRFGSAVSKEGQKRAD
jgi:hypothetical protein